MQITKTQNMRQGQSLCDVHAQLHTVRVAEIERPGTLASLRDVVLRARNSGRSISIAGGRHSMGAQAFGEGSVHVDTSALARVLDFDPETGLVEVEAGILWPELVERLHELQPDGVVWSIRQKQTGADRLSIGGALAANVHGRGLTFKPFVEDVDSFRLIDAGGDVLECSRTRNTELFRLAIGGYGLFGLIYSVRLRLAPRRKLERVVQVMTTDELIPAFEERVAQGFTYGDFQFAIDPESDDFLHRGVFSCYRPVDSRTPIPKDQKHISREKWEELLYLAHVDKAEGFRRYSEHYLATDGQVYWSDTHQMGTYVDGYHTRLDARLQAQDGTCARGTEVISEVYVPRDKLAAFLVDARAAFRAHAADVIYGTMRLIRRDDETFLPWAREDFVSIVFNLHTDHTPRGIERSAGAFRAVIDVALTHGGSFFLTYHRFATREQVEAAYPEFRAFLAHKLRLDPEERFHSDWYDHYRELFGARGAA